MEARRLVCGDAYAFQGDERHVVFLSMVSAPNVRIGTLAGQDSKQRFNVAASRAQDQLWLFHSVSLEDLSDRCVRRRLLEYCLSPYQDDTVGERYSNPSLSAMCTTVFARAASTFELRCLQAIKRAITTG